MNKRVKLFKEGEKPNSNCAFELEQRLDLRAVNAQQQVAQHSISQCLAAGLASHLQEPVNVPLPRMTDHPLTVHS